MKGTGKGMASKIDTSSPNKSISLSNCSESLGKGSLGVNAYSCAKSLPSNPKVGKK